MWKRQLKTGTSECVSTVYPPSQWWLELAHMGSQRPIAAKFVSQLLNTAVIKRKLYKVAIKYLKSKGNKYSKLTAS